MKLQWLASVTASGQYAAAAMLRGRAFVDPTLTEVLEEPVETFRRTMEAEGVNPIQVADNLTAISVDPATFTKQVWYAVSKTVGEARTPWLAVPTDKFVQAVQHHFTARYRDAAEELELRSLPIRELWEARGPGMLKALEWRLGPEVIPASAEVILTHPVTGGDGVAYVQFNRVSLEAMLANIKSELPEILRLGWLLAQLHLDLPVVQGNLMLPRVLQVGALGLVPAVLAAARDLDIVGPIEPLLPQALELWRLDPQHAETLQAWWETYEADQLSWPAAVVALDRMLGE